MENMSFKDHIWFLGRSYLEYLAMFDLNEEYLRNQKILDCASGASSFTPTLLNNGFDVKAVDILYDSDPEILKDRCVNDFYTLLRVHSDLEHKVDWSFFQSSGEMIKDRVMVYHKFIEDYKKRKGENYINAKLPILPFDNEQFTLVLCSHLLFLYEDRLNYQFHRESIKEMLRVTSDEVRIYPLVTLRGKGKISSFLNRIIIDLDCTAEFNIIPVEYNFRKGGNYMLKITKKSEQNNGFQPSTK